jgi:hypothetical protein
MNFFLEIDDLQQAKQPQLGYRDTLNLLNTQRE